MIKLHDKYFKPFISAKESDAAISKLENEISNDLGDEIPVFIGILNGSFMVGIMVINTNDYMVILLFNQKYR